MSSTQDQPATDGLAKSKINDSWHILLFISMLFGPSIGILQFRLYHIAFMVLLIFGGILILKNKGEISKALFCNWAFLAMFIGTWFAYHTVVSGINVRYFMYLFYFVFTFSIFSLSYKMMTVISQALISKIIVFYILLSVFVALVELVLGTSILAMNPLSGIGYQTGSAFWGNVNTNVVALMLFNSYLFIINKRKTYYALSFIIIVLGTLVDAKLGILGAIGQLVFFQIVSSMRVRIFFAVFTVVLVSYVLLMYSEQIMYFVRTFDKTAEFLTDKELLKTLVASGKLSSLSIRAYTLNEMLSLLSAFSFFDMVFGIGFGQMNLSFYVEKWGMTTENFPPHFFYLEVLIYSGLCYYLFYYVQIKLLLKTFPWKKLLLFVPTFASIIAISSAVYFIPLYFFLASIVYWQHIEEAKLS